MRPNYLKYFDRQRHFYGENATSVLSYPIADYPFCMKTLPFQRDEKKQRVTVACADGDVSVYSHCAYCRHCAGVRIGTRVSPAPQTQALKDVRKGRMSDDNLMNAAMLFNSLVRDGTAIECADDEGRGFTNLY